MSDWKEGAIKRRDERHIKSPDKEPSKSSKPSKKDTKKWCKGKVGKEHQTRIMSGEEKGSYFQSEKDGHKHTIFKRFKYLVCVECGKELDVYYGGKKKPEWLK